MKLHGPVLVGLYLQPMGIHHGGVPRHRLRLRFASAWLWGEPLVLSLLVGTQHAPKHVAAALQGVHSRLVEPFQRTGKATAEPKLRLLVSPRP